jgi:hypothetical protein
VFLEKKMNIQKSALSILLVFAVVLTMASTSMALSYSYATDVRWDDGTGVTLSSTVGSRYNQTSALGSPDSTFLSLGLGGLAVFDFGAEFDAAAVVFETTYGTRSTYPESANVYVADSSYDFFGLNSVNGGATINVSDFNFVASISNATASTTINLTGGPFRYLLVQDATAGGPSTDGFDVNAVGVSPVPEPGTLLLIGSGLAGLALYRRRMNKA